MARTWVSNFGSRSRWNSSPHLLQCPAHEASSWRCRTTTPHTSLRGMRCSVIAMSWLSVAMCARPLRGLEPRAITSKRMPLKGRAGQGAWARVCEDVDRGELSRLPEQRGNVVRKGPYCAGNTRTAQHALAAGAQGIRVNCGRGCAGG